MTINQFYSPANEIDTAGYQIGSITKHQLKSLVVAMEEGTLAEFSRCPSRTDATAYKRTLEVVVPSSKPTQKLCGSLNRSYGLDGIRIVFPLFTTNQTYRGHQTIAAFDPKQTLLLRKGCITIDRSIERTAIARSTARGKY